MSKKRPKPTPGIEPINRKTTALVCLAIAILTALAYMKLPGNGFIQYDDLEYLTKNNHIAAGLTPEGIAWAFRFNAYAANWHPLTWISHMLDISLFGLNPAGHHSVGLIIHILSAILLFLILNRMTGSLWKSAFVAALFALHPLHVESVAWASERKDVLSTLFWMLTMGAYVLYVEKPGRLRYAIVIVLYALGLMAKPMLVTLPFALLLLDWWPLERTESRGKLIVEKLPMIALAVVSSAITFLVQRAGGAVATLDIPISARVGNALLAYVGYIEKMLLPTKLAIFYPFVSPEELPAMIPKAIAAGIVLVLVTIPAIVLGRKNRYITVGWLFYIGTLIPVIGLVQVGDQSMADRYTYIPLIGLFIALTWGIADRLPKAGRIAVASVVLIALTGLTWVQVGFWHDSISLFRHTIAVTDRNYLAHYTLGGYYDNEEKFAEARAEFEKTLAINPRFSAAHNTLGVSLMRDGDIDGAIKEYNEGLRYSPDDPAILTNLGSALSKSGRLDEAEETLRRAIELSPEDADAHNNMAIVHFQKRDYAAAWQEVDFCRKNGVEPDEGFIQALTAAGSK